MNFLKQLIIMSFFSIGAIAHSAPLVASLDSHTVAISIDFTGNEVLLFGSVSQEGEVIVLVQGPRQNMTVRRKSRSFGIWYNAKSIEFENVPGYYAISYSGDQLPKLTPSTLQRHEIAPQNINMQPSDNHDAENIKIFKQALIEQLQNQNRISDNQITVERLGDNLFRTSFFIPSNAPIGTYRTEVFLVNNGKIISAQATPLFVSKTGVESLIYNFAYNYKAFYGIMAILLAALAGYIANETMRKR